MSQPYHALTSPCNNFLDSSLTLITSLLLFLFFCLLLFFVSPHFRLIARARWFPGYA